MNKNLVSTVAVIPARGNSKRIPGKNLSEFGSKPALAHSIKIALDSGVFSKVLVSTEDPEIAKCASREGAEVVNRPTELADDYTPIMPVIVHAIQNSVPEAEVVCLVLATAILLAPERLRDAHTTLMADPFLDYVIGVRRFDTPPQQALFLDQDGFVSMESPKMFNKRSQDLPPLYYDAAQFSFGRREAWLQGKQAFTSRTRAIQLPRWEAIDIDEPEDLAYARLLFEAQLNK